jgi:kanamycin kinase
VELSAAADAFLSQLVERGDVASAELVWVRPSAGHTYRLTGRDGTHYLKVAPVDHPSGREVLAEAECLRWVGSRVPVPTVLGAGSTEHLDWLRTRALPGIPASDLRWRTDPSRTARLLGHAVRSFHDGLSAAVGDCPWQWRIADRLAAVPGSAAAPALLEEAPEESDLVVAHGDLCLPNVLLSEDGSAGFVDLGKLGVADRAADLGCHVWSLEYNELGAVVEDFLAAYGHPVDRTAVQWYRDFYTVA